MANAQDEYPQFYEVDDIPVCIELDPATNEVSAKNWAGHSKAPLQVRTEGRKIDEKTFHDAVKAYRLHFVDKTMDNETFDVTISKLFGTQFYKK